ncbi:type II toxin-antitoxin system RatA family toxin [Streptomyces griseochromogenes]|uniref:type II toxin-antitoxin system RatA family toxin n=1 Tax=Streptomyces griseochromogenes TaxID=68214 RepID=UPI003787FCC4
MRTIHLRTTVPADDPDKAFERLVDFTEYSTLAEDVRSVRVHPAPEPGQPRVSEWEVNFRRGIMKWSERDVIDPVQRRVVFDQIDGDFERLEGTWQLDGVEAGCEITFEATYDFGVDSLAGIMDPPAERVIKRSICSVLAALFGEVTVVVGGEALTDLAAPGEGVRVVAEGR